MKLPHTSEVFNPAEDQTWLGSKHAVDTGQTVTLDASLFEAEGIGEDGVIPSGVLIGPIDGSDLYGPASAATVAASEGHLLTTINTHGYTVDSPASLMWHGRVIVANLPAGHGLTTATAVAGVTYDGDVPAAV